jgi:hypothetical protein
MPPYWQTYLEILVVEGVVVGGLAAAIWYLVA